ncbi:MAG: hypothetical protein ACLQUY_16180 [Ktedonobacterales bacterium]
MYQLQPSLEAPTGPDNSAFALIVLIVACGIIFSLPLIFVQASLLYLFRINYPLASHDTLLLLTFTAIELLCSFLAALLVTTRSSRLWPGILCGGVTRLLSGIIGLYFTAAAWHEALAQSYRPLLAEQAAQLAFRHSVTGLLVTLLLCLGIATLGAILAGRSNANPTPAQVLRRHNGGSSTPTYEARIAGSLPFTPTPGGWRFGTYDYSHSDQDNSGRPANQWRYSSSSPSSPLPAPGDLPQVTSLPAMGDALTQPAAGSMLTELPPEDTPLPLPYPGRDS